MLGLSRNSGNRVHFDGKGRHNLYWSDCPEAATAKHNLHKPYKMESAVSRYNNLGLYKNLQAYYNK